MSNTEKKIIYLTNSRLPTEKAHGLQIAKMCEAWVDLGINVELLVPKRINQIKEDFFDFYLLDKKFKIIKLFCLDFILFFPKFFKSIAFWIETISFFLASFFFLKKRKDIDFIYTRDLILALSTGKKKTIFEAHFFPKKPSIFFKFCLKRIDKLVVITEGLKREFVNLGIQEQKILVAADGVDIEFFSIPESKQECRKKMGLPVDKKIVLYTGHLYKWKGVNNLLAASKLLPKDCIVVLVGGTKNDIENFQEKIKEEDHKNILLLGYRPYSEIPYFLKAADVLVLPNSAKQRISRLYTSPMKLFEYLAAGVPIVASDLPSIREVLSEKNSLLIKPDDVQSLAEGINEILENKDLSDRIVQSAKETVKPFAWDKRAEKIKQFIFN